MQGLWSGTISFSLVAIPVRLVKAIKPGRVAFHLLHNSDYSPLVRRMFCPKEQALVPSEEIVRGFEIGAEQYLPVTAEELDSVTPERSRTIEIVEFIDLHEIDPLYFDHPYYLVPLKGGEKAYQLLAEIMRRTNKAGLAKFVFSEREYLVAIRSEEGALALFTLHYQAEIIPAPDFSAQDEPDLAAAAARMRPGIQAMRNDFRPETYTDQRRRQLLELLQERPGRTTVQAPAAAPSDDAGPADLLAALEEIMRGTKPPQ